ncbi:MAG: 4Fe-4S double cluster binding domain-containing protein [Chrysiogenales bacterium]
MKVRKKSDPQSRREFLKQAGCAGALMCLGAGRLFSLKKTNLAKEPEAGAACQFRSVSVAHIPELKAWMDQLDKAGKLTANKTWRRYIGSFQYAPPPALANARSLIVMSTPLKVAKIIFNQAGRKHTVLIPSGYVDDGLKLADYHNMLYQNGIVTQGSKLERARLPLKQLAVRSGLATYGKNNITFVEGYGSFHQLLAFYSEQQLDDHWGRLKLLRLCKGCSICMKECPTRAIAESNFVIDPEKCITLYNELPDPLPDWIPANAHNALVGCLKCQYTCPGNEDLKNNVWDLGEVSEAETALLLENRTDAEIERSLRAKLQRIGGGGDLPYIARNLKLVLKAQKII